MDRLSSIVTMQVSSIAVQTFHIPIISRKQGEVCGFFIISSYLFFKL